MNIFLTFFLTTYQPRLLSNNSDLVIPLHPPNTLLKLFQTITSWYPNSPNSPFSLLSGIPVMKILEKAHFVLNPSPYCVPNHKLCAHVHTGTSAIPCFQTQEIAHTSQSHGSAEATCYRSNVSL